MSKGKIKIHIRNNHWKKGSLPCDLEGEKNSSVPKDLFESCLLYTSPSPRDPE